MRQPLLWLVLLAAAGTFALTMGARQSMGLFLGNLNTSTGLGLASISLAFAFGQLFWGLTQPLAGIVADRIGAGRVLFTGVLLVGLGTALIPLMHSTAGLVLAIGVLVKFKPDWTRAQIDAWVAGYGVTVERKLAIDGNWFRIQTDAGAVSLQIANAMYESGQVLAASPNWWMETKTR